MKKVNKNIAKIIDLQPGSIEVSIINNVKGVCLDDIVFYNLTGEELYFTYLDRTIDGINPSVYIDYRISEELSNYVSKHKKLLTCKSIKYISKKSAERRLGFLKSKYEAYGESKMFIYDLAEYKSLTKLLDNYNNMINTGRGLNLPKLNMDIYVEFTLDDLTNCDVIEDELNKVAIGKVFEDQDFYVPSFSVKNDVTENTDEGVSIFYTLVDNETINSSVTYWVTLNSCVPVKVTSIKDDYRDSGVYQFIKHHNGKVEMVDYILRTDTDKYCNNVFHNKSDAELSIKSGRETIEKLRLKDKDLKLKNMDKDIKEKEIENKEKKLESMNRKHEIDSDIIKKRYEVEVIKVNSEYVKAGVGLLTGLVAGYIFFKTKIFSNKEVINMFKVSFGKIIEVVKRNVGKAVDAVKRNVGKAVDVIKRNVGNIIAKCKDWFNNKSFFSFA